MANGPLSAVIRFGIAGSRVRRGRMSESTGYIDDRGIECRDQAGSRAVADGNPGRLEQCQADCVAFAAALTTSSARALILCGRNPDGRGAATEVPLAKSSRHPLLPQGQGRDPGLFDGDMAEFGGEAERAFDDFAPDEIAPPTPVPSANRSAVIGGVPIGSTPRSVAFASFSTEHIS